MATHTLNSPLKALDEAQLHRLARVAERLLAGRPRLVPGNRPHRLRAGAGVEFLDHREYQPGDSLRQIDWLASARSGRTQVRRYRNETAADWFICLDRSASMGIGGGTRWHLAVQLCAALAYLLLHLDNRVGLLLFSDHVDALKPLGRGQQAYSALLRLLERQRPVTTGGGSCLRSCIPHIRNGCQIMVISDFLTLDAMQNDLTLLARIGEGTHAIQILDPADTAVPGAGIATLEEIESGHRTILDLSERTRRQAAARLQALQQGLARHCQRQQIAYSLSDSSDHWRDALLGHLLKLGAAGA